MQKRRKEAIEEKKTVAKARRERIQFRTNQKKKRRLNKIGERSNRREGGFQSSSESLAFLPVTTSTVSSSGSAFLFPFPFAFS